MPAHTIQEVLRQLDQIIEETKQTANPNGYFAALYQGVTQAVADKMGTGYFEDDARMERLDVIFANRYLEAYQQFKLGQQPTQSWALAFEQAAEDRLIVLQHLLLGMNAHISLDLGIAAAEISTPSTLPGLENDFRKINKLLASLVERIQRQLITIWPKLHWVLVRTGQIDNYIIDFSMELARKNAWEFAQRLIDTADRPTEVTKQDTRTYHLSLRISNQTAWRKWLIWVLRWGERGTVAEKIGRLSS